MPATAGFRSLNALASQCLPGQQPNEDRTACVDCDQLDGVTFSASGAECLVCGGTQAVNGIPDYEFRDTEFSVLSILEDSHEHRGISSGVGER